MTEDPFSNFETSLNMSEYLVRIGLLSEHQKDLLIQRLRTNPDRNAITLRWRWGISSRVHWIAICRPLK